jgi:hypothetical protein
MLHDFPIERIDKCQINGQESDRGSRDEVAGIERCPESLMADRQEYMLDKKGCFGLNLNIKWQPEMQKNVFECDCWSSE